MANNEPLLESITHGLMNNKAPFVYTEAAAQPTDPQRKKIGVAAFQLTGICVYLYEDGTWEWQDTTGG